MFMSWWKSMTSSCLTFFLLLIKLIVNHHIHKEFPVESAQRIHLLGFLAPRSILRNPQSLSSPVLYTPPISSPRTQTHMHSAPGCLIHNSLSKLGRDVLALDENKVNLPYPQFSLEVRRITFTSGLGIV